MKRPTLSIEEATMVLAAIAHDSTPEEQDRANALAKVVYTEHFMDKAPVREFGLFIFSLLWDFAENCELLEVKPE